MLITMLTLAIIYGFIAVYMEGTDDEEEEGESKLPHLETGEVLKANPTKIAAAYLAKINAYNAQLTLKCAQYKIDYVTADIQQGFTQVLQAYLIKRQKMG